MADEVDPFGPVFTFFFAWFGLTLAVFPLAATVDTAVFRGSLSSTVVVGASAIVTIPAALEFVFSDRDPRPVATFVVVFVALYFVALVVRASVYVSLGMAEPIAVVEFVVVFAAYGVTYALVYRDGLERLTRAVLQR